MLTPVAPRRRRMPRPYGGTRPACRGSLAASMYCSARTRSSRAPSSATGPACRPRFRPQTTATAATPAKPSSCRTSSTHGPRSAMELRHRHQRALRSQDRIQLGLDRPLPGNQVRSADPQHQSVGVLQVQPWRQHRRRCQLSARQDRSRDGGQHLRGRGRRLGPNVEGRNTTSVDGDAWGFNVGALFDLGAGHAGGRALPLVARLQARWRHELQRRARSARCEPG